MEGKKSDGVNYSWLERDPNPTLDPPTLNFTLSVSIFINQGRGPPRVSDLDGRLRS